MMQTLHTPPYQNSARLDLWAGLSFGILKEGFRLDMRSVGLDCRCGMQDCWVSGEIRQGDSARGICSQEPDRRVLEVDTCVPDTLHLGAVFGGKGYLG
jgi:hypothetical protein